MIIIMFSVKSVSEDPKSRIKQNQKILFQLDLHLDFGFLGDFENNRF